jgi:prophage antirepressor-like protein
MNQSLEIIPLETNKTISIFTFQDQPVRFFQQNEEIWFVVADACKALEIANVGNAIGRLDKDGIRQADVTDSSGRIQEMAIANEPNFYRLVFRSDKPEAKAFQDRVYKEVLPSIRKYGCYPPPVPRQQFYSVASRIGMPIRKFHITNNSINITAEDELALVIEYVHYVWNSRGKACTANDLSGSWIKRLSTEQTLLRLQEAAQAGRIDRFETPHSRRFGGKYRPVSEE